MARPSPAFYSNNLKAWFWCKFLIKRNSAGRVICVRLEAWPVPEPARRLDLNSPVAQYRLISGKIDEQIWPNYPDKNPFAKGRMEVSSQLNSQRITSSVTPNGRKRRIPANSLRRMLFSTLFVSVAICFTSDLHFQGFLANPILWMSSSIYKGFLWHWQTLGLLNPKNSRRISSKAIFLAFYWQT